MYTFHLIYIHNEDYTMSVNQKVAPPKNITTCQIDDDYLRGRQIDNVHRGRRPRQIDNAPFSKSWILELLIASL